MPYLLDDHEHILYDTGMRSLKELRAAEAEGLLNFEEAGRLIGLSRSAISLAVRKQQIPSHRFGPFHGICKRDALEYLTTRRPVGWPKGKPRKVSRRVPVKI